MEGVGHPTCHPRCIRHVATYASARNVGCCMPRDHLTSSWSRDPHRCSVSIMIKTYVHPRWPSTYLSHKDSINTFKSCFVESFTLHHKHLTVTRGATVDGKANIRLPCRYTCALGFLVRRRANDDLYGICLVPTTYVNSCAMIAAIHIQI